MQQVMKPFPPFGAVLHQLQAANIKVNFSPYIFCGKDALAEARIMNGRGQLALCLPYKTNAADYKWPINTLSIILFDTGETTENYLKITALTLLSEGARQVCLYRLDPPSVEIYNC